MSEREARSMLSSQQIRQLAQIAESLTIDDPALACALSRHRWPARVADTRRRWWRSAIAGLIVVTMTGVGLGLLAIGLRTGEAVPSAGGAVVMVMMPLAQLLLLRRR